MSTEENKALVHHMIEAMNRKNLSQLDEYISTNCIQYAHGDLEGMKGLEALKQFLTLFYTAFPDIHQSIDAMIAEGDIVACRHTYTGTHTGGDFMGLAPTGKKFSYWGIAFYRIADGKVVECWIESDRLGHMQQIGMIPSP